VTEQPETLDCPNREMLCVFLDHIYEGRPRHLVAIDPDGPAIEALTFEYRGGDRCCLVDWAVLQNARGRNIYFSVNEPKDGVRAYMSR
jgi:hypothetical protein